MSKTVKRKRLYKEEVFIMRRQVLSLLVENNPGVTSHISGLFSRRGYNIDSFSSGVTADPRYTRITIVASGDEQILEQIEKQLAKLEDVVDIKKLEPGSSVTRELILVKIRAKDPLRRYSPSLSATSPMSRSSRPRTIRTCRPTTTPSPAPSTSSAVPSSRPTA